MSKGVSVAKNTNGVMGTCKVGVIYLGGSLRFFTIMLRCTEQIGHKNNNK